MVCGNEKIHLKTVLTVTLYRDTKRDAMTHYVVTHEKENGMGKVFEIGDIVDYHSIIGRAATSKGHEITRIRDVNNEKVVWITGKSGCVAIEALSKSEQE